MKESVSTILNPILIEFQEGNFSIFKKHRRQELEQILKLDYREVPIEFSNFVIKRLVEKKGKNCPLSLVAFCIQCLGYYFLKENGIEKCAVEVKKLKDSWGNAAPESIEFSISHIAALKKGRTEPLETVFHEINHEIQIKKKNELTFSYCTYEWLQDTLLYAFIGDPYYSTNYERVSIERDSRIKGSVLAYRYLKEISPKTAKKMKQRVYRNAKSEYEKITPRRCVGFLFTTREELFDELISKKSEILEVYPFLKKFYHDDGSKKTLAEILLKYKGMKDQRAYYEVRYSKEELKENRDYKTLLTDMAFYIQFLKNRMSSYENTKNDYLSLTTDNIPFLQACANDEWLESERNRYLTKFEKKYAILAHLGNNRNAPFVEEALNSMNHNMRRIENACASTGKIGILRRTVISIQKIWTQSMRNSLSKVKFKEEPIENLGVSLNQHESSIRK